MYNTKEACLLRAGERVRDWKGSLDFLAELLQAALSATVIGQPQMLVFSRSHAFPCKIDRHTLISAGLLNDTSYH